MWLILAVLQAASAESSLVEDFRALCIEQDGQPEAVYRAADVAGWSLSENGAYRVRDTAFGRQQLSAADVDGRLLCMVSIEARLENMGLASLERGGVEFETRRLPSGNEVHILRSASGAVERPYRIIDAEVLADSTVLMFVKPAAD